MASVPVRCQLCHGAKEPAHPLTKVLICPHCDKGEPAKKPKKAQ